MLNSEHLTRDGTNLGTLDTLLTYHHTVWVPGYILNTETFLTSGAVVVGHDGDRVSRQAHQSLSQLNIFSFLKMFGNTGHSLGVKEVSRKCSQRRQDY